MASYGKIKRLKRRNKRTGLQVLTKYYYVRIYEGVKDTWVTTKCTSLKAAREWVELRRRDDGLSLDRKKAKENEGRTFLAAVVEWPVLLAAAVLELVRAAL